MQFENALRTLSKNDEKDWAEVLRSLEHLKMIIALQQKV